MIGFWLVSLWLVLWLALGLILWLNLRLNLWLILCADFMVDSTHNYFRKKNQTRTHFFILYGLYELYGQDYNTTNKASHNLTGSDFDLTQSYFDLDHGRLKRAQIRLTANKFRPQLILPSFLLILLILSFV